MDLDPFGYKLLKIVYFAQIKPLFVLFGEQSKCLNTILNTYEETETLKFIQSDLTESFADKFPIKFDFMFTNAVLPHIPLEFKSDVFKNLAEIANPGCIFVMYDGMLNDDGTHKHDNNTQANFENWNGKEIIRVVFISEKWIRENAPDWEIVQITNVGHATEEIILKRK